MPKKKETQFELNWKTAEQLLEERKNIERIPTGTPLDELIGGGIEVGEVIEFYGEYGSGKTQISFTLATYVSGQLKQDVVFIDCEGTFRPERIREIAINRGYDPNEVLKRIYVAQPKTTDEQIAALEKIPKDIKPKLIVIDGVTTLFRSEYIGRETLAEKQGLKKIPRQDEDTPKRKQRSNRSNKPSLPIPRSIPILTARIERAVVWRPQPIPRNRQQNIHTQIEKRHKNSQTGRLIDVPNTGKTIPNNRKGS